MSERDNEKGEADIINRSKSNPVRTRVSSTNDSLGNGFQAVSARSSSSVGSPGLSIDGSHHHKIKDSAKRKLSESRGVHLPDIKIVDPNVFTAKHQAETISTNGNTLNPAGEQGSIRQSASLPDKPTSHHTNPLFDQSVIGSQLSPPMTSSPIGHVLRHPFSGAPSPASSSNAGTLLAGKGVLNICIFFPDQRGIQFSVEGGKIASTDVLLKLVWNHLGLPPVLAEEVFALWMVSPLLEIQLKGYHVPFQVRKYWSDLLRKFSCASDEEIGLDEPLIIFRRNVLLSKKKQRILCDNCEKAAELLFLDARESVLSGKYVSDLRDVLALASIDMALTLGPYDQQQHGLPFIREVLGDFLPEHHLSTAKSWSLFSWAFKARKAREEQLLENYKKLSGRSREELHEMYLHICMNFPFYGAAFFNGQIEKPRSCSTALVKEKATNVKRILKGEADAAVRVAISRDFFTVIDAHKHTVLLAEPCFDCNWQKVPAADPLNPNCLPSFFLHFPDTDGDDEAVLNTKKSSEKESVGYTVKTDDVDVKSNGGTSAYGKSKLLQIFSKQAVMMEALLNSCVDYSWSESEDTPDIDEIADIDETDGQPLTNSARKRAREERGIPESQDDTKDTAALAGCTPASPVLSNKLEKLCLATFDEHGNCIEAVGSLQDVLKI